MGNSAVGRLLGSRGFLVDFNLKLLRYSLEFPTQDSHAPGCFNGEGDAVAGYPAYLDCNVIAHMNPFTGFSAQY